MFCSKCGTEVSGSNFCTKCGSPITEDTGSSIIFVRKSQFYGSLVPIKVILDGREVASMTSGEEVKIPASLGTHKLSFNLWSGKGDFDIEISEANPNVKVTFKLSMGMITSKPKIISIENV